MTHRPADRAGPAAAPEPGALPEPAVVAPVRAVAQVRPEVLAQGVTLAWVALPERAARSSFAPWTAIAGMLTAFVPECDDDLFCSNPDNCVDNGTCNTFTEGCVCADCAGLPECER